ncbi:MAG: rubredoxin [Nevskia sp.]|nr:rubredoxin [Nevskia sp.]
MARYRCPCCGHIYDEAKGEPHEGYPPGTRWESLPDDWQCPDCSVREKADFEAVKET